MDISWKLTLSICGLGHLTHKCLHKPDVRKVYVKSFSHTLNSLLSGALKATKSIKKKTQKWIRIKLGYAVSALEQRTNSFVQAACRLLSFPCKVLSFDFSDSYIRGMWALQCPWLQSDSWLIWRSSWLASFSCNNKKIGFSTDRLCFLFSLLTLLFMFWIGWLFGEKVSHVFKYTFGGRGFW